MKNLEFEAIGTHWFIEVYDEIDQNDFEIVNEKIVQCCREFENNYSRFKDESILSRLNKEKTLSNPSTEFLDLITLGNDAKLITNGHFDITVATVLENLGYDKNYSFESKDQKVEKELEFSEKEINLGKDSRIDLGGVGKGFLVDKIADLLKSEGIKYFFINAGGDIYCTSNFEEPVEFALENPFDLSQGIGTIKIKDEGIASSSVNRRRWKDKTTGEEYNHIVKLTDEIDPKARLRNRAFEAQIPFAVYTESNNTLNADLSSTSIFITEHSLWPKISKELNCEYLVVFEDGKFFKSEDYSGELFT